MFAYILLVLLVVLGLSNGIQWKNCEMNEKRSGFNFKNASHLIHECEDEAPVTLSCKDGYKIAILYTFFGHGHGHKSTCDSSLLGQNCGAGRLAMAKVKYLCQNRQKCVINPTTEVLGSTSCTLGLDSDLHVRYTCNKEYIPNAIVLNSLNIAPSPLTLPGTLNFSASLSIDRLLAGSTKLKLKIQKKMLFWITIPCVADFGSCTYENFCQMLRSVMFNKCDKEMEAKGVPCDCPFPTGTFTIPTQTLIVTSQQIKQIPVPNFLVNGEYYVKAEFLDVYDRPLGCIEIQLKVHLSGKKKRSLHIEKISLE